MWSKKITNNIYCMYLNKLLIIVALCSMINNKTDIIKSLINLSKQLTYLAS